MANNPIIGRMKCPVCGEPAQDIKVNKNGNLYIYCDNGCRVNLSGKVSRKIKPVLLSGNNTSLNGAFITSIKGMKQNETKCELRTVETGTNRTISRDNARIEPIGRTDGGLAGVQPSAGTEQQPKPRGILASFFDDDE